MDEQTLQGMIAGIKADEDTAAIQKQINEEQKRQDNKEKPRKQSG